jgi:Flp pilus assembly pilin Flp
MPHLHIKLTLLTHEHGQTMTEMAVILALVVLMAMVGITIFSGALTNLWDQLASTLPNG